MGDVLLRRRLAGAAPGEFLTRFMCYTDPVQRNLTLTLDEELLRAARKTALDRNTSVNQLVRDYLTALVRERDRQEAAIANLDRLFREHPVRIGRRTWTRQELHER